MLIGLVLLGVGLGVVIWGVPRERPPLVSLEETLVQEVAKTESVQIVLFEASPDERLIETPLRKELELSGALNTRLELILQALREEALGDLWPEALAVPTVFTFEADNGVRRVAVLDFAVPEAVAVSVDQEKRLLESIRTTLLRNGVNQVHVLVNHRETSSFLGHVAVKPYAEP